MRFINDITLVTVLFAYLASGAHLTGAFQALDGVIIGCSDRAFSRFSSYAVRGICWSFLFRDGSRRP
jgi:hypothetical protein